MDKQSDPSAPAPFSASSISSSYSGPGVSGSEPSADDPDDIVARLEDELYLTRKPLGCTGLRTSTKPTTNTAVNYFDPSKVKQRGQLLHQCLPISCMKLFEGFLLVMSEGPCLLLHHPKHKYKEGVEKCKRIQIFPNQLTIAGIEFVEDSCGYPARDHQWNGPNADHSLAFIWSGNHGIFVTMNRRTLQIVEKDAFPANKDNYLSLSYIPIAARWFENGRVLVILSVFNYIVIYERTSIDKGIQNLKEIGKYECEPENLYSGAMDGDELDELIIFSGTTFKGILIWDVMDGKVNIRHKLTGHQGIPFSLEYNSDWKMLLSASDDRSVIAWSFLNEEEAELIPDLPAEIDDSFLMARKSQKQRGILPVAKIIHRLQGHEARVWKSIWVQRVGFVLMVSVGEDSWVRMTSFDKMAQKFWKAHDGASIYQCVYDQDDDHLYTAAHDGSIFRWKRFYLKSEPTIIIHDRIPKDPRTDGMYRANKHNQSLYTLDYPRGIVLWDSNFVVASMDGGRILGFYYYNKKQFHLFYDKRFKRYCVLSVSRQRSMIAMGSLKGDFVVLKMTLEEDTYDKCQRLFAEKAFELKFDDKILNIIWIANNQAFVVCLEKAYLLWFFYEGDDETTELCAKHVTSAPLKLERPGVPTAVLIDSKYIVAGDESGSLLLFKINIERTNQNLELLQTIDHVHAEGVTSIVEYKSKIRTAGKFGGVKSFVLEGTDSEARLVKVHEFVTPFEWIGKLLVTDNQEDMLIGGFHKKDFIIYSWNERRILNEISEVGGGHRRWDFKLTYGNAAFAFIRDREIYYSTTSIDDRANNVLKPGLHYKTVNCGIILRKRDENVYLATGSDDGTVRIFRYNSQLNNYYPIHKINSHASSIRALASLKVDNERYILFSGGGRSEVFASLVGLEVEELEMCGKIALVKSKNRETETDTRIMDLAVTEFEGKQGAKGIVCFCACSDGSVRALIFSLAKKKFAIVSLFDANSHSVMKIELVHINDTIVVHGVTSNGCLLIWNWKPPVHVDYNFNAKPEIIQPLYSKRIRNAALMSLRIVASANKTDEYLMAVGSDDCCLSFWKFKIVKGDSGHENIDLEEMWHEDQTQRGAVVGVEILDNLVLSCSNDQVIAKFNMEGKLLGKCFAGVPDCQGFIVSHLDDCITCFGDGVTWISCP